MTQRDKHTARMTHACSVNDTGAQREEAEDLLGAEAAPENAVALALDGVRDCHDEGL